MTEIQVTYKRNYAAGKGGSATGVDYGTDKTASLEFQKYLQDNKFADKLTEMTEGIITAKKGDNVVKKDMLASEYGKTMKMKLQKTFGQDVEVRGFSDGGFVASVNYGGKNFVIDLTPSYNKSNQLASANIGFFEGSLTPAELKTLSNGSFNEVKGLLSREYPGGHTFTAAPMDRTPADSIKRAKDAMDAAKKTGEKIDKERADWENSEKKRAEKAAKK